MSSFKTFFNKYLFPLLPILILLIGWRDLFSNTNKFNNLVINSNNYTNGYVANVKKVDAMNGSFFDCKINYEVNEKSYVLDGIISAEDRKIVNLNDTVKVLYNDRMPKIATINPKISIIVDFLFYLFVIGWTIYSVFYFGRLLYEKLVTTKIK